MYSNILKFVRHNLWGEFKSPPTPSIIDILKTSFANSNGEQEFKRGILDTQHYIEQYGEIIRLKSTDSYIIAEPSAIRKITQDIDNYNKDNAIWRRISQVVGKSLLSNSYQDWEISRAILKKGFTKDYLNNYYQTTKQAINDFKIKISNYNNSVNLMDKIGETTLDVMLKSLLDYESREQELAKLHAACATAIDMVVNKSFIFGNKYIPTKNNLEFHKNLNFMNTTITNAINQYKSSADKKNNFVAYLLATEKQCNLKSNFILDEIKTLILTGFEITASCITWTLLLLIKNPDKLNILQQELENVDIDCLTNNEVQQLPYLKACIAESLRLYPAVPMLIRQCIHGDTIGEYKIDKNSTISINIYAMHRNPKYWENPQKFLPERFYNNEHNYKAKAYVPYIHGPRTCMGINFAKQEIPYMLAMLIKNFAISIDNNYEFKHKFSFSLYPENLYVKFQPK